MSIIERFKTPDMDAKPMLRWWLPDAGANPAKLAAQVREMYAGGFGGAEVAMVPQFTSFDAAEYGWGTPRWRNVMKTILKAAQSLPGPFKVDFTITAHWPPALNTICPNDEAHGQTLVCAWRKLGAAHPETVPLPMPEPRTNDGDAGDAADYIFVDTFVALTAGRVADLEDNRLILDWDSLTDLSAFVSPVLDPATGEPRWTPAGIPGHETRFGDWPKLRDRQYYHEARGAALPVSYNDEPELSAGDWVLFAFYSRGTGQSLSGRSMPMFELWLPMAPKMYSANYYSDAGTDAIIDFWNKELLSDGELAALLRENGGAIFEDSIESAGVWAPEVPQSFLRRNGYALSPYLPFVALRERSSPLFHVEETGLTAVSDNGKHRRVMEDLNKTLGDMYLRHHVGRIMDWTHGIGCAYRAQSYGGDDIETCEAALVLDIAEGESLGFGDDYDHFRNIAGGVHLTGRKFVSDEICADLMRAYGLTWGAAAGTFNQNFAAGVNRGVVHGASFEEEISGLRNHWPGWHAFQACFADPWGRRHPSWEDAGDFTDYVARTQAVLQSGKPRVDLLVYEKSRPYGRPVLTDLLDRGYTYDVCGNGGVLLPETALGPKGRLAENGPAYGALILREADSLPVPAAEKLLSLAEDGFPIVVLGPVPGAVTGLDIAEGDARVQSAVARMLSLPKVRRARTDGELPAALEALGVAPALGYDAPGVLNVRRFCEDGADCWFLFNSSGAERTVPVGGGNARILDAWTGEVFRLDRGTLRLGSGETKILVRTPAPLSGGPPPPYPAIGRELLALDGWELEIESWGPAGDPGDPTRSKKTRLPMGRVALAFWDALPAPEEALRADGAGSMENVSGIGYYKKTFTPEKACDAALFMAGGEDMIAGVTVNGVKQPPADQALRMTRLRGCLKAGENTVEIKVASTLKRRVKLENPFFSGADALELPDGPLAPPSRGPAPEDRYGLTKVTLAELEY